MNLEPVESAKNFLILDILNKMRDSDLENIFICLLEEHHSHSEGIMDLMEMWFHEIDSQERDHIIADLHDILEDHLYPSELHELPSFCFEDLKEVKNDIIELKKHLQKEVDRQGGVSEIAKKTGIPLPSLNRFFHSHSMPRKSTLHKIIRALNLSETQTINLKWVT